MRLKYIYVDLNIDVVIDKECVEGNFIVMMGEFNKKDKKEEGVKMIKVEVKFGIVKFEKEDWFSFFKLS